MAEKNTESTAVNQLIELVATAQPLRPDPSEDLMFRDKPSAPPAKRTMKMSASSASTASTASSASSSPSGPSRVDPLPRGRAPVGTQQGLQTIAPPPPNQTIKAVPPGVRITTPSRSIAVPPLTLDYDDDDVAVTNPGPATFSRPTSQGFSTARPSATGSNAARLDAPPSDEPLASRATKPTLPPPLPTMRASVPPPFRPSSQMTSDFSYPVVPPTSAAHPKQMPIVAPFETEHTDVDVDDDPIASLLEPSKSSLDDSLGRSWMENEIGTQQVAKKNDWKIIAGKLVGPMVVLVIAGIFIGGYFAFDGDGGKKRKAKATEGQKISMPVTSSDNVAPSGEAKSDEAPAPTADVKADEAAPAPVDVAKTDVPAPIDVAKTDVAKTEPAPVTPPNLAAKTNVAPVTPPNLAATTEPAKTEPAKTEPAKTEPAKTEPAAPSNAHPALVDIRLDSNPTGATVTLIDRGKSTFLGTTPMSAAVDASRKYELVFSYENRATVVESLDPSTQKKVSVKLSRAKSSSSSSTVSSTPVPAAAKIEKPKTDKPAVEKPVAVKAEKPVAVKADKPAVEKPVAVKADKIEKVMARGAEGTLMISSKPPCEIIVDGTATGLTTPQREIKLPAGAHKITLVNTAEGIKKTVSVQITADKPTKVIQDFMK